MRNVDNFDEFRKLLDFSHPNSFYFLQIIQRSKDDNTVTSSNNRYRRVKSYYIASLEEYNRFIPEIKKFCENNNARAYIRLSPISFYDVAINTASEYMRRIKEKQTFKSCNIYDSCCEKTKTCGQKLWMIDLDSSNPFYPNWFTEDLIKLGISQNVVAVLPTVNGVHYIMKPFDIRKWKDTEVAEIKKHNPITLLYYNDLSCKQEQNLI